MTLVYDNWWVDSGEFISRTYAHWLARVNGNDNQIDRWLKDASCVVEESVLYPMDYEETINWWNKGKKWSGDLTCGAGWIEPAYDLDGTIQYNADGSVEFVQPG